MNIITKEESQRSRKWWLWRTHAGIIAGEPVPSTYTGKLFRFTHHIQGEKETFWCFTHDETITRIEAIEFCKMILDGKFHIISIDLSKI